MTRKEYLDELYLTYSPVDVLSKKKDAFLIRLRHRVLEKDIVVRSTSRQIPVAPFLMSVLHPNLPEVYDVVTLDDGVVILEEALNGVTLNHILKNRLLTKREAKEILFHLIDALIPVHEAGFVHRDIKPQNVMIMDNGNVKLVDFDSSRRIVSTDDTVRLGTAGFAAPEQYIGTSDQRSDVFALGILLNVMLTGRHPSEILPKNRRIAQIINRATSMNPEKRFSSVSEFKKAL